ncbi:MAG: hypothetical protein JWR48_2587 [Mycobacterium sp.]|jgi:hypothetical protein|nr:hypothetical protein [Mycobacterium sp.]
MSGLVTNQMRCFIQGGCSWSDFFVPARLVSRFSALVMGWPRPTRRAHADDRQLRAEHGRNGLHRRGLRHRQGRGGDGAIPVNSGTLVLGLQLGCQVDLSEGGSLGVGADAGISPGFSNGGNLLNVIGPYAEVNGNASINLLPGTITNLGLGKEALKGRTGEIVIHGRARQGRCLWRTGVRPVLRLGDDRHR